MRRRLVSASIAALLVVSVLIVPSLPSTFTSFSTQPPVDTSTYRSATIGFPSRFDPARASDSSSQGLIQNVYEPLIFFGDKPVAPNSTAEITDSYVADVTKFVAVLATKVPSVADGDISPDGKNWTFTVNTNAVFQPWIDATGAPRPSRNLTVADVVYSFQRQMVYDSPYAPTWMWFEPAFGIYGWSKEEVDGPFSTYDNGTFKNPDDEVIAGNMIQSWVVPGPGINQVTFHFQETWPENMLEQTFAGTWSSILNKDWVIEHGGWDGLFTQGWTNNYHWKPTKTRSELDVWKDPATYGSSASKYPSAYPDISDMCGTGPYKFTGWKSTIGELTWQIDKFTEYWRGWSGNHVVAVIKQGIDASSTRIEKLLSGEVDDCAVSTSEMSGLLNSSDASGHTPVSGVRLYWNIPGLGSQALLFLFNVSPDSPYVPKNGTSPAPDLFADVHMRRAFAYALNLTRCLNEYSPGRPPDLLQMVTWWLRGTKPDYENRSLTPRNFNTTMVEEELKAAGVWEQGFKAEIVYTVGSDVTVSLVVETSIAALFTSIDPKFDVSAVGVSFPTFLDYQRKFYMPIFTMGYSMPDFCDPEDLARAYMYSNGSIASMQRYNDTHVDYLVDLGLSQPDGPERNTTYQELQYIYWRDVPSLPLTQWLGRSWFRDWVRGWYYNPLYPGTYYYDLYKVAQAIDGGGQQQGVDPLVYEVPIIVIGIALVTVGAIFYVRRRRTKAASIKQEPAQPHVENSLPFRHTPQTCPCSVN